MNKATVSSAVSHGKLSHRVRQAQPLSPVSSAVSPVSSAVAPTVISAVSHGSAYRSLSYSVSLKSFQDSLAQQATQSVRQTVTQASRRLTPLTSEPSDRAVEAKANPTGGVRP